MFEQDYIMRLIKEMVRMVLKLLFNIDMESPTAELLENAEEKEALEKLLDMVDVGDINGAENRLYDLMSDGNRGSMQVALLFYSYLNEKPDEFLETNNFSREEVKSGMEELARSVGLGSIASTFLDE